MAAPIGCVKRWQIIISYGVIQYFCTSASDVPYHLLFPVASFDKYGNCCSCTIRNLQQLCKTLSDLKMGHLKISLGFRVTLWCRCSRLFFCKSAWVAFPVRGVSISVCVLPLTSKHSFCSSLDFLQVVLSAPPVQAHTHTHTYTKGTHTRGTLAWHLTHIQA